MKVVLFVTWFYYGQPPVSSQIQFESMEKCSGAREVLLFDAGRLRFQAEQEVKLKAAQGIIYNPVVPTVSAICVVQ